MQPGAIAPGCSDCRKTDFVLARQRQSLPLMREVAKIFDFRRRGCFERRIFMLNVRESEHFLYNPPVTVTK